MMKKYLIAVALLYGGYYYYTRVLSVGDPLEFAKKHKQEQWAPALEYYTGIIYYQKSEYPKAQAAFTQLLTDYPTGQYTARALLKLVEAAESSHDWETAKTSLARYIDEFPAEKEVEFARHKLDLMKYQHP